MSPDMKKSAVLSPDGKYRFTLARQWEPDGCRIALFVMLNPSTADAYTDDPTIRRCIQFAKDSGHGAMGVVNLFAYRTPDPRVLKSELKAHGLKHVVGEFNDLQITKMAWVADTVICAWGANSIARERSAAVLQLIAQTHKPAHALRVTSSGYPAHPLYLPGHLRPVPFGAKA